MLGRYQILKPLAKGGMAEVFLARAIGLKGFERHIVLKFIRVEHGAKPQTVEMLLDEARLVAALHHRNIVQVHDVGQDGGQYFFAMEYVHGEDCRALLRKVKDVKQQIPFQHILTVITAAAAGLHYAHEMRGPDRKPLGIVHRDISPGNILIGFDGGVKVVDFGIAKTDKQSENTQAGEMKGKVGYMSPEQCKALPLDRRTDIYMLGIVLYELCTVRRLFKGENRFDTMAQIVEGNIAPPSRYRKDLPDELERIILKALATDPNERYQTADDLRLVIEAFATRANYQISPSKLSDYLKDLFGERLEPWLVDAPPPDPHTKSTQQMDAVHIPAEAIAEVPAAPSAPAIAAPSPVLVDPPASSESTDGETPMAWPMEGLRARRKRTLMQVGLGAAAVVGVILAIVLATGGDSSKKPIESANETKPGSSAPAATPDAGAAVVTTEVDAGTTETAAATIDAGVSETDTEVATKAKPDTETKTVARPGTGRPAGPRPGRPSGGGTKTKNVGGAKVEVKTETKGNPDLDAPMPD